MRFFALFFAKSPIFLSFLAIVCRYNDLCTLRKEIRRMNSDLLDIHILESIFFCSGSSQNGLSAAELQKMIAQQYDIRVGINTIYRHLQALQAEQYISADKGTYRCSCPLSDIQLHILSDCIRFCRFLPGLTAQSVYHSLFHHFSYGKRHFLNLEENIPDFFRIRDPHLETHYQQLSAAIEQGHRIEVILCGYDARGALTPKCRVVADPVALLPYGSGYYLLCHDIRDKAEKVRAFRLERLKTIRILKEKSGSEIMHLKRADIGAFLRMHPHMAMSGSIRAVLAITPEGMESFGDWFEQEPDIIGSRNGRAIVSVLTDRDILCTYIMSHCRQVIVLSPQELAAEIQRRALEILSCFSSAQEIPDRQQ